MYNYGVVGYTGYSSSGVSRQMLNGFNYCIVLTQEVSEISLNTGSQFDVTLFSAYSF